MAVGLGRFIAGVALDLYFGRETGQGMAGDAAFGKEALRRVAVGAAARKRLDAAAASIELDRVEVDAATSGGGEDEAGRAFVLPDPVSKHAQRFADGVDAIERDNEVKVIVIAGLLREEGVHAPATIKPDVNA